MLAPQLYEFLGMAMGLEGYPWCSRGAGAARTISGLCTFGSLCGACPFAVLKG